MLLPGFIMQQSDGAQQIKLLSFQVHSMALLF